MLDRILHRPGDPRPHGILDCHECPAICEVPASYYTGMDLKTCAKCKICPCGFDPVIYRGCIHERPTWYLQIRGKK